MRFYVPTVGDKLYLTHPWNFTLHEERRNTTMADRIPSVPNNWGTSWRAGSRELSVTLPPKTELVVDRIYIRKGQPEFDSITYRIASCPDEQFDKVKGKKQVRFWVKLADANRIQCQLEPSFDENARLYWSSDERFEELE